MSSFERSLEFWIWKQCFEEERMDWRSRGKIDHDASQICQSSIYPTARDMKAGNYSVKMRETIYVKWTAGSGQTTFWATEWSLLMFLLWHDKEAHAFDITSVLLLSKWFSSSPHINLIVAYSAFHKSWCAIEQSVSWLNRKVGHILFWDPAYESILWQISSQPKTPL